MLVSCDRMLVSCDRKLVSCDRKSDVSLMSHRITLILFLEFFFFQKKKLKFKVRRLGKSSFLPFKMLLTCCYTMCTI